MAGGSNVKEIPLTQGKVALVDDEDYEMVNRYKWCYAQGNGVSRILPRQKTKHNKEYLSVFLFGIKKNIDGLIFIDGNKLNYSRKNVIVSSHSNLLQGSNRKNALVCSSDFVGVFWHNKGKKWQATISFNNKSYYLGLFSKELEAAAAYNKKAIELYGPNAKLNPLPLEEN